jgi:hypothetical protein
VCEIFEEVACVQVDGVADTDALVEVDMPGDPVFKQLGSDAAAL